MEIKEYPNNPSTSAIQKIRVLATKMLLMDGELYRRSVSREFLRCIGPKEALLFMAEAHEGIVVPIKGDEQ